MPDPVAEPLITVTLANSSLGGGSPFTIDPPLLTIETPLNTYQVVFALASAITGATLIGAGQTRPSPSGRPPHVTEQVQSDGTLLVTFDNPDRLTHKYKYEVAVQLPSGVIVISPDPEIEIPPGP